MKTTIRTILCAAAVMLAAASCQKSVELANPVEEGKGTIDIRVNGLMGEYTQVDGTKASLVNNVRVSWEGGETVYVYDGTHCLGSLAASLEGDEDRYAVLSTDDTHIVSTPGTGTEKLTLVYSPLLTEAPAVSDGVVSISLADQSGAKAPFVAYATLDYTGTTITNAIVPFKFATSVIKVNCTGLKANTAITSATLSNVNTACKLTLSGTAAPTVSGSTNGTITRTGDEYFAAAKVNAEGEAVFQIAVPALESASEARVLTVAQGSDKVKDKKFATNSLAPATSVNTVCQLVGLPAGALAGEFSVSATKTVYFSKGNLVATIDATGAPTAWKFAANQYDCIGNATANTTIGSTAGDVDLFGWSTDATSNNWGIHTKTISTAGYTDGDFKDWGKNIGDGNTWRTLSKDEWTYLFENHYYIWATVNGVTGYVIAPDGFTGELEDSYANDAALASAGNLVFLPAAGYRDGSRVDGVGVYGYYWSSTASSESGAFNVLFVSYDVDPDLRGTRMDGCSVRLITEPGAPAPQVISVESVSLNKSTLELAVGSDETLTATVTPDNATDKNVSWSSSDESVATVDASGKVTAVAAGTATITVTTTDGGKTTTCAVTVIPAGALAGEFSVSATKKVHFSKGNLTYNVSTTTGAFYEHQYDCATGYDSNLISLFTWGYGTWSTSPNGTDYQTGDFTDWGSQIGDGNTWRTLTTAEWQYLFNYGDYTSDVRNGKYKWATVNGVGGYVIAPDDFTGTLQESYANDAELVTAGDLVFLPAAGIRGGSGVYDVGDYGSYWSSTASSESGAYSVNFDSDDVFPGTRSSRHNGISVRLITESK